MNREQFEHKRPITCHFGPIRCITVPPHQCLLVQQLGADDLSQFSVTQVNDCLCVISDNNQTANQ